MDADEFEQRMRALECYHSLRLPPGAWIIVRVDGRSFSRFTAQHFQKPFDDRFHALMVQTARALLEEMQGVYAFTESDEISLLLHRDWDLFDRELEKVVSLSAAIASATFTLASQHAVQFDSRVWLGPRDDQAVDYFRWRQEDATRCGLNGTCYWLLRQQGKNAGAATRALDHLSVAAKNELLFQNGINFNDLPAWQRRGTGIRWEIYEKTGYDPKHERTTVTLRRRIAVAEELPMKDAYAAYIQDLLELAYGKEGAAH
jgi:tRNA(His) guanylyltransferase